MISTTYDRDAKPLVSRCEIFALFLSVLDFVGAKNETGTSESACLGSLRFGALRQRAGSPKVDPAVAQFIGWRQAEKPQPEKSYAKEQLI